MDRKAQLWPVVCQSLHSLMEDYDQVVIEGAGSPAEINLRAGDIVNMSVALECQADVYLVADIDRGGAFAHLLGTWACLAPDEQALIKGFVLNKFPRRSGSAGQRHELAAGAHRHSNRRHSAAGAPQPARGRHPAPPRQPVAGPDQYRLVGLSYASNLDEFDPLIYERGVSVVPMRDLTSLDGYHAIILRAAKTPPKACATCKKPAWRLKSIGPPWSEIHLSWACAAACSFLGRHIFDPDRHRKR